MIAAAGLAFGSVASAQPPIDPSIVLDGTFDPGNAGLPPPTSGGPGPAQYLIDEVLGETVGPNLFHSFQRFGISEGESATFTGSGAVEAIFARVTGAGASEIDGLLRSAIPDASFFLLNPDGILTGPGAEIDVGGSLTLSTADYVTFADLDGVETGVFHATNPGVSLLSMDAPAAFGFMDADVAPIEVNESVLAVAFREGPAGGSLNSLSLIGGDLRIQGGADQQAVVGAKGGDVVLVSVASAGEVGVRGGVDVGGFASLGDIEVLAGASVVSSGLLPSEPALVGGCCALAFGLTPPPLPPGRFEVGRYMNGSLHVLISAIPAPFAEATGDIIVRADDLTLEDASLFALTGTDADGGAIDVALAGDLTVREVAGQAGIFGGSGLRRDTGITAIGFANGEVLLFPVIVPYLGSGDAADLTVSAQNVFLENGGSLDMETNVDGNAGNIDLLVRDDVVIAGANPGDASTSGIFSDAFGSGGAGSVRLTASRLLMRDRGAIDVRTRQDGAGGDIEIRAVEVDLEDAEITARSEGTGDAGAIRIGGVPADAGHPQAGTPLDEIALFRSAITTEALQAFGGSIDIAADTLVAVIESEISTNVGSGQGDGGNITIAEPYFVVLDGGAVTAQADVGNGGNILIESEFFIASDSLVSASSNAGVDGIVEISALDDDLNRTVSQLPAPALDATRLLAERCAARSQDQTGSFVVGGRDGVPPPPDGFLPATGPVAEAATAAAVELDQWIVGGELALVGRCRS